MLTGRFHSSSTIIFVSILITFIYNIHSDAASNKPAWGRNGVVSSAHVLATEAGVNILEEGGNAIDAALATIYMLNVVEGYSAGIGGGEFWVIRIAETGEVVTIDGREEAPATAFRDMYLDSLGTPNGALSYTGILAGGVPGSVAAREYAFKKYASQSRKKIMKSAIDAAENGFMVEPGQAAYYEYLAPKLGQFEYSKKVMFKDDSTTWQAGDILVQKDLAETFKRIAKDGGDDFYHGKTAEEIVRYMKENGGIITAEDLANYQVKIREPIYGNYRGYEIYSMPPPSSGGVHLVQILNILEGWDVQQLGRNSARWFHHLAEAMEAAFADRAEYLGDPDYVIVPVTGLTSKGYAEQLRNAIPRYWSRRIDKPGNPVDFETIPPENPESGHTTHMSVIDRWGNMVALTATINTGFGSGVVLGSTGIFLNNEMDDFSIAPGTPNYFGLIGKEANAIEAGKRPLSSMCPTIITKDGKPFMSVGGSGGPKIITGTLQAIINVIDFELNVQKAVSEPRIHHQWVPDALYFDQDISPDCAIELNRMGHKIAIGAVGSGIQAVMIDQETGIMYGGADPRSGGLAKGLP